MLEEARKIEEEERSSLEPPKLDFHLGFKEFKVSSPFSSLGFLAKSLKCMLGYENSS